MIVHYGEKLDAKIKVFISSTFRDMQSERNIIVGSVFPLLRRKYKNQCVDISEVDLRWGITEKDIEKLVLLEICIAETLNCVPFFIGLIGDNYGTLARLDEIKRLPPSYKRAIGMKSREDFPEGVSITELEMRAGVFTKRNTDYARFFIREAEGNVPEEIERLKATVIDGGYAYSTYKDLKELEESIYNSLDTLITNSIPEEPPAPYGDRHYISHLRRLKKSNASYVPNDAFIEKLEDAIHSTRRLYIRGGKGTGKSSAISHLIAREGVDRDGNVFFHFTDANEESGIQDNLYYRLRRYLESVSGVLSNDTNNYNAVLEILKNARFDKGVVLYFDAIEKYNDTAILSKLFAFSRLNEKVSVVCTGTKAYENLAREEMEIAPLDREQIRQMIVRALHNYGKKLGEGYMSRVFDNPSCKNPLFLHALLNQLIAYGNHERFDSFFDRLMLCQSFEEIFNITVERLVEHFDTKGLDAEKIYKALALMAYSNMGVRESELGEIIGMLPLERSIFLASLEIFISENSSLIRFNHDLIVAATKKLLDGVGDSFPLYARDALIRYFEDEELCDTPRAYSELAYQYSTAKLYGKLFDKLASTRCFMYLAKNQYNNLVKYLVSVADRTEELGGIILSRLKRADGRIAADVFCQAGHFVAAIKTVCFAVELEDELNLDDAAIADRISDKIVASPIAPEEKIRLFATLARSCYKLALCKYATAERAYLRAIEYYRTAFPNDTVGLATQSYLLGVTYKSMGKMDKAEKLLCFAAEEYDKNEIKNDVSSWVYAVFGNIRSVLGDIKTAKSLLRRAIVDSTFLFGEDSSELAWSYSYAWAIYYTNGERNTAFNHASEAYRIYNELYQGRGSKIAWAATNYGSVCHITERSDEARACYELSIRENNAPVPESQRPHVYSLTTYVNLALLEYEQGNVKEAIRLVEYAREHSEKKNGEEHIYTANTLLNEGIIKKSPEIIRRAIEIYEHYETPDRFFARNCYARVLLALGEEELAEQEIDSLYEDYAKAPIQLDVTTYLINESYEKISFSADEDATRTIREKLTRFSEYKYYVSLNNNSALIIIPEI